MKKLITILSAIGLTATSASLVVACSTDSTSNTIVIGPTSTLTQVEVGKTASVNVFVSDDNAVLTAASSDESVATAKVEGRKLSVTGVKIGSVTITLSTPGASDVKTNVSVVAAVERQDLNAVVSDTQLGVLKNFTSATISAELQNQNPGLDLAQISITNRTEKGATVSARGNSPVYDETKPPLDVHFSVAGTWADVDAQIHAISEQSFKDDKAAIAAAKEIVFPTGLKISEDDDSIVAKDKLLTVKLKSEPGYVVGDENNSITIPFKLDESLKKLDANTLKLTGSFRSVDQAIEFLENNKDFANFTVSKHGETVEVDDSSDSNRETEVTIAAEKGYKLADDQLTSLLLQWNESDNNGIISPYSAQAALDEALSTFEPKSADNSQDELDEVTKDIMLPVGIEITNAVYTAPASPSKNGVYGKGSVKVTLAAKDGYQFAGQLASASDKLTLTVDIPVVPAKITQQLDVSLRTGDSALGVLSEIDSALERLAGKQLALNTDYKVVLRNLDNSAKPVEATLSDASEPLKADDVLVVKAVEGGLLTSQFTQTFEHAELSGMSLSFDTKTNFTTLKDDVLHAVQNNLSSAVTSDDLDFKVERGGKDLTEGLYNSELLENDIITVSAKDNSKYIAGEFEIKIAEYAEPVITAPAAQEVHVGDDDLSLSISVANSTYGKFVTASSSDSTVATVENDLNSNSIKIHAVKDGTVTVSLSYPDAKDVSFTLEVKKAVPSIKAIEDQELAVGAADLKLDLTVNNSVTDKFATAVSSDTTVATVTASTSANSLTIKAVKAGTTTITVSYSGAKDVTFVVTVPSPKIAYAGEQSVTVGAADLTLPLTVNNSVTDKFATAVSSDTTVATVTASTSANSLTIKGLKEGSVTITVSYANADDMKFQVKVNPVASTIIDPVITNPSGKSLTVGAADLKLDLTVNNSVTDKFATAVSSDTTVATVTASTSTNSLTIKAVKAGTTTITVSYDGANDISFAVKVVAPSISPVENQNLTVGAADLTLPLTVNNSVTDKFATAVSSDTTVATVTASTSANSLTIKAVKAGTTTITVKYENAADVTFTVTVVAQS